MTDLITAVDHVPIVVADLGAAVGAYSTLLGRAPNWEGRLGPNVRHAWFQLPNLALDIIAADGDGPDAAVVKARLEKRGEGPAAIAWRVSDLAEATRRLSRRAIAFGEPGVTRSVAEDGRTREWRYAEARASTTRGLTMMLIEADAAPWPVSAAIINEADAGPGADFTSWSAARTPTAPSPSMAAASASTCGSTAPTRPGAHGRCSSPAAA